MVDGNLPAAGEIRVLRTASDAESDADGVALLQITVLSSSLSSFTGTTEGAAIGRAEAGADTATLRDGAGTLMTGSAGGTGAVAVLCEPSTTLGSGDDVRAAGLTVTGGLPPVAAGAPRMEPSARVYWVRGSAGSGSAQPSPSRRSSTL